MRTLIKISIILSLVSYLGTTVDQQIATRYEYSTIVNADALNLRYDPGLNSDIIMTLDKDTEVTVLKESDSWSFIKLNDDPLVQGFVKKKYLEVGSIKPSYITTILYLIIHLVSVLHFVIVNRAQNNVVKLFFNRITSPIMIFYFLKLLLIRIWKSVKIYLEKKKYNHLAETWNANH